MTSKQSLIDDLRAVFAAWEGHLAGLAAPELATPLAAAAWSLREIIVHLGAWQQISLARLEGALAGTEPLLPDWLGGADPFEAEAQVDAFNARIQEQHRSQPGPVSLQRWRDGFRRLLELAEAAPEPFLFDRERFPWLRGHSLAEVLEGSRRHHQGHLQRLRAGAALTRLSRKLQHLESLGGEADLAALELVVAERIRQFEVEGFTPAHDDAKRKEGQLSAAGACYALQASRMALVHARTGSLEEKHSAVHPVWPFSQLAWKPASMRRNQVKATALNLAELARQIRAGIP
jgi:hypothetical protein